MESSGPSAKNSEVPEHRWHVFLGNIVGVLTLLIPMGVIGYFSYVSNLNFNNLIPENNPNPAMDSNRFR
jgi:hypothetical protein